MATDSSIEITAGSGTHVHASSRSYGGTTKLDQYFLRAAPTAATYSVIASGISGATSADHILQIMGDGTNYGRLFHFKVTQLGLPAAETVAQLQLLRLTTAGTGGTSITNKPPYDAADTDPYAGGAMTLPTAKGTEGNLLLQQRVLMIDSAIDDVGGPYGTWEWFADPRGMGKGIIFGSATTSGLAWKIVTGITSLTVDIVAEFIVDATL